MKEIGRKLVIIAMSGIALGALSGGVYMLYLILI